MASRGRRAVLSLTTRFCLPHEGMATLDYLSSGSAVLLRTSQSPSLAVITCQHVACPWLYPRYFESTWSWLQFVNEDFVRHSLQLLAVDAANCRPQVLLELPLAQQVQTHDSRDLALLTLADSDAVGRWEAAEKEFGVQTLAFQNEPCGPGDGLIFSGHRQLNEDDQEEGYQLPKTVDGHFVGRSTSGQEFAWTAELLEEGMCGGAVVDAASDACVGIVEGIVPAAVEDVEPAVHDREAHAAWHMRQALAGHVAFVPSSDVRKFIDEPGNLLLTGMELPPHM
ncbi:hypothetical protein PRNP1_004373 [Phytophthora ramorum]